PARPTGIAGNSGQHLEKQAARTRRVQPSSNSPAFALPMGRKPKALTTRILSPRVAGSSAGGATRLCVGLSVDASPVTEGRSGTRALPAFGLVDAGKRSTDSRDTTSRRAGRRSVTRALPGPPPAEVADRVDDRHGVGDPASSRLRSSRMSAISRP